MFVISTATAVALVQLGLTVLVAAVGGTWALSRAVHTRKD